MNAQVKPTQTGQLVEHAPREVATLSGATPADLVAYAMKSGAPMETLEKFVALQERWEANEARKQFNKAFAAFKSEAVKIIKGTDYTDGPLKGRSYANLFDIVNGATPCLSKHGLSISWKLTKDEPLWMEVTCTLRHEGGHSESAPQGGAPDTGPGRNAIQARGSARTYLEKYTATSILGLAAQDADDDGAGGPRVAAATITMTEAHQIEVQAKCEEISKTTLNNVLKSYKVKKLAELYESEYDSIMHRLEITSKGKS